MDRLKLKALNRKGEKVRRKKIQAREKVGKSQSRAEYFSNDLWFIRVEK